MGLLHGSVSLTRFNVVDCPEEVDFEALRFEEIPTNSEIKEQLGFVPFELDAPYQVGQRRWVFRVRIDQRKPDTTAVRERLRQLIHTEMELTGVEFVGAKKRKQLRQLAEEELLYQTTPRSKIIEGCIDNKVAYLATTAKNYLGLIVLLLRKVGVVLDFKTPWLDVGEAYVDSEVVRTDEPGQSVLGCRFLRELIGDRDVALEPESGSVRLQTEELRVSLSGAVLKDLRRYIEQGAEVLSAKLKTRDASFRFDALSYRLNSLQIEVESEEHWTERLDARLERIAELWQLLDDKYETLMNRASRPAES